MQNTFPRFNTSFGSYPLPLSNAQMGTTTFPTNSWFEHAFNPLIPDQNRYGQAIPWYWLPFYTQNTMNLCYTGTVPFNNHNEQGNLVLQEDPINDITVGTPSPTSLNITALDDFTATFVQTSASGSVTSYPMRGSPFATFVYNSTPVSIVFNRIQPITNFTALPGNIGYVFDTPFSSTSTFHSSMVPQTNGSFQTGELAFYNGPNNTGLNATATYSDNSKFTVTMNLPTVPTTAISVTLLLGSNIPPFLPILPLGYTMTYSNTDRNVPSITVTTNNNESLSVNGDLHQVNYPYAAYTTYTHPQNFRWFIFTNATLTVTNNPISTA